MVDGRSDLFSLGAVLYEMATGHRVFERTTPALTFDAILNRRPPPPRTLNAALPAALDGLIMRLIAKEPSARFQNARDLAEALATPARDSGAHRAAAHDWDWDRTRIEFERAVALNPRVPATLLWHGLHLALIHGDFAHGIEEAERAVDVDPLSGSAHGTLGTIQLCAGDLARSQRSLERALELDPRMWVGNRYLGLLCLEQERFDAAEEVLGAGLVSSNRHPWVIAALAETYQRMGRTADADALTAEVERRGAAGYIQLLHRAFVAAAVRRRDEAIEWLDRAYRERNSVPLLNYFVNVRGLTDDPRFEDILGRTGVRLAPRDSRR